MPFDVPTLAESRAQSRDDVAVALQVDALPGNSPARILADANGAHAFENFQYLEQLAAEFLPDGAQRQFLRRWAAIYGLPVGAATFAEGPANATGIAGSVIPDGTPLSANGFAFQTMGAVTLGLGPTEIYLRALDAGAAGNLPAGTGLSLGIAIAGVDASAVVVQLFGGSDAESDDSLRDRVLFRMQRPPMGGDADDYVAWAREVPGVTRAWCSPHEMGPGSVTIRFMMDELRADQGGYPFAGDVAIVQAHIDERRPVTVQDCFVSAPIPEPVPVAVNNLVPDTSATRAAAVAGLKAMIRDRAAPARAVNGSRVPAQTIHEEWMSAAILEAAGVSTFNLVTTDHVMPYNASLAELGTVTFGV